MPNIDLMGATYPDVPAVTLPSGATTATFYYPDEIDYASSPSSGGNANRANAILYGTVDSTSTATAFTATVDGLTELTDGTTVMLHNGVVTSASGFTVNVNGLGAKPCYNNMTNATRDTTIFNVSYTMLFVYSTALDSGSGGWWIYRGYDGNTNTIGYQLRTNSGNLVASDTGYRYRLWLTSADGSRLVPINTSTSTNATSNRTLNTRPIDPFGPIVYRATNGTCTAGTGIGATAIWQQYTLNIGYSYMASGFSLTAQDSVYLRCTPQTDGSAVMQDIVQTLPTSKDGKIYIHLGTAYSTTNMELTIEHPVYWHDGTGIRLWTGAESGGGPEPSSTTPAMDGTAAVGTATTYARADHVHPTDTSRQATLVSGTNIKTINGDSILGSGDLTVGGGGTGGMTLRGARVTIPRRTSTGQSATVAVNGLGEIDAHDIVLFFGGDGSDIRPDGFIGGSYMVHVSSANSSAFDAFAAIISPNYEVGSQASIVGSNASLCNTTTPLVGDTVTITATSGATFKVYDAASGGVYASSSTVAAGGTYSFTVECATSYIASVASGGGND